MTRRVLLGLFVILGVATPTSGQTIGTAKYCERSLCVFDEVDRCVTYARYVRERLQVPQAACTPNQNYRSPDPAPEVVARPNYSRGDEARVDPLVGPSSPRDPRKILERQEKAEQELREIQRKYKPDFYVVPPLRVIPIPPFSPEDPLLDI